MNDATESGRQDAPDGVSPAAAPVHARLADQRGALAAFGLLVAVFGVLLWWLFGYDLAAGEAAAERGSDAPSVSPQLAERSGEADTTRAPGQAAFHPVTEPVAETECADVSFGQMVGWFEANPCERVIRGLYETGVDDSRALVSLAVVTMPAAEEAEEFLSIAQLGGTGNVSDLVRDSSVEVPGAVTVSGEQYASQRDGSDVTIVEASFVPGEGADSQFASIDEAAEEAMRLATELR